MDRLLLTLLLSALPLYLCSDCEYYTRGNLNDQYERFLTEHTYSQNTPVDCNDFMNKMLPRLRRRDCKMCNDIILGDYSQPTNRKDLRDVCRGVAGYRVQGMFYRSYKPFRQVSCWALNPEGSPPNCQYATNYIEAPVTVGCEVSFPVYIHCC